MSYTQTSILPDASATKRGAVNLLAQTFAGAKTFTGALAAASVTASDVVGFIGGIGVRLYLSGVGGHYLTVDGATGLYTASSGFNSLGAPGTNAFKSYDGARWNFSTADASAYLARNAANVINTPGKLTATAGLGVGNSEIANTANSVIRKMEVFDAAGTSLGFVAIYDSII